MQYLLSSDACAAAAASPETCQDCMAYTATASNDEPWAGEIRRATALQVIMQAWPAHQSALWPAMGLNPVAAVPGGSVLQVQGSPGTTGAGW